MVIRVSIFIFLFFLISCSNNKEGSNLRLIHDARIFSFESDIEKEFEAMILNGDKILAIGSYDSLLNLYPNAQALSMNGKTIYPGLHDAHTHFYAYGKGLNEIDLRGSKSFVEMLNRVSAYADKNPSKKWLIGRGWDQNLWPNTSFPDNAALDSLFPDKLVFLKRIDGHAALVNDAVLDLANINALTKVEGGIIVRSETSGQTTGVLVDKAIDLVNPLIEEESFEEIRLNLLKAQEECIRYGITAVTEAGLSLRIIKAIDSLQKLGELKIRIVAMLNPGEQEFAFATKHGSIETDGLIVRSFKLYADGALGSRGALLKSPYCDKPSYGLALHDKFYFEEVCKKISDLNFQACTHCIGDSANKLILDVYALNLKKGNDKRWRIEHAQVLDIADIELFRTYNVIPSVQPTHATSDGLWAESSLCQERMTGAYAYQSLLKQAGLLALGTDFPVEEVNPFLTYLSAVYRSVNSTSEPFRFNEHLTHFQTMKGMTYWPAFAGFTENKYGSLQAGMKADFIILTAPLNEIGPNELKDQNPVKEVWIDGKKMH